MATKTTDAVVDVGSKPTTLLDLSLLTPTVAEALRAFDGDGDGLISLDELYHGAHASIADKRKIRTLGKVVFGLLLLLVVQLGATFGLVFAVMAVTKDTKVDSTGALVARDGTYLGTTAVTYPLMTSDIPDSAFNDVRSIFYTTTDGASVTLAVNGHIRLPASTLGGTAEYGPLVMLTQNGNFLMAGQSMVQLAPQQTLDALVADATAQAIALSTPSVSGRHLSGSLATILAKLAGFVVTPTPGGWPQASGNGMSTSAFSGSKGR